MTLLGYQRALTTMIASPELCLHVRSDPVAALASYDLSARERRRLAAVALQPGMSTSCTLHRVNRMTPIYSYLPLTCLLLGNDLMRETELFWTIARPANLQFGPETERFASFLRQRLIDQELRDPYLDEVLTFELAANRLQARVRAAVDALAATTAVVTESEVRRRRLHPRVAITPFRHDPLPLLRALAEGRRPDPVPAVGDYFVALDATGDELRMSEVEGDVARSLIDR